MCTYRWNADRLSSSFPPMLSPRRYCTFGSSIPALNLTSFEVSAASTRRTIGASLRGQYPTQSALRPSLTSSVYPSEPCHSVAPGRPDQRNRRRRGCLLAPPRPVSGSRHGDVSPLSHLGHRPVPAPKKRCGRSRSDGQRCSSVPQSITFGPILTGTDLSDETHIDRGPVLLSHSLTFFPMTLRLEGRSVSGDQFRAASGRIFGGRFPLTSLRNPTVARP